MSLPQLRRVLEADGVEFQEFRNEIRNEILSSRLRQRVVSSMEEISETEIDILLASEQFSSEEYLLSQIAVMVPESATPDQVSEAQNRVREVYEQLEEGMAFSAAAISYSQAPDALEGGDVGWRSTSAMPRAFADALQGLEPGGVTQPIRTPAGFVILQVRDVRERSGVMVEEYQARHLLISPSELVSPEEAREQIQNLRRQIQQGEDFAELAREYSSDESTANLGGLLDWFPAGAYGAQIQETIDALEPGEVSEPFRSARGWHLVKLLDVRRTDRTEETLRSEAREMLMQRKSEDEVERFMRQLRSEAFVEIRL
jgi:peptidyl-prolyl cis-trans isomerase SurA